MASDTHLKCKKLLRELKKTCRKHWKSFDEKFINLYKFCVIFYQFINLYKLSIIFEKFINFYKLSIFFSTGVPIERKNYKLVPCWEEKKNMFKNFLQICKCCFPNIYLEKILCKWFVLDRVRKPIFVRAILIKKKQTTKKTAIIYNHISSTV